MNQRDFAKQLRREMTDAEQQLWYHLRAHRFCGWKFKRQYPIGDYIVDFIDHDHRLIIELDGAQHLDSARDLARDARLQAASYLVLRFWNDEVMKNTEGVLEAIRHAVLGDEPPLSPVFLRGEGKSFPTPLSRNGRGEWGEGAR